MEAISFISEVDTGLNSHAWLAYKISFVVGAYECLLEGYGFVMTVKPPFGSSVTF